MKKLLNFKNKKILAITVSLVIFLILLGYFTPVQSVSHSDWCADWNYSGGFKERYSLLRGQKTEFDKWNNNNRLAIGCEPTEKSVKLYLW